jgi:hypothetical protein
VRRLKLNPQFSIKYLAMVHFVALFHIPSGFEQHLELNVEQQKLYSLIGFEALLKRLNLTNLQT